MLKLNEIEHCNDADENRYSELRVARFVRMSLRALTAITAAYAGVHVAETRAAATPIAVSDAAEVVPGGSVSILTGGNVSVLTNDRKSDLGITQNAALLSQPSHGSAVLNIDGTFLYQNINPAASSDEFKYWSCDEFNACSSGSITITVTSSPSNHVPFAVSDLLHVGPGGTVSATVAGKSSLLGNDFDADGRLFAYVLSNPAAGDIAVAADGTFVYTNTNASATQDAFVYQACDEYGACAIGDVYIGIDNGPPDLAPVAVDDVISIPAGGTATLLQNGTASVLANDSDQNGDPMSALVVWTTQHGTLSMHDDGTFSYTNDPADASLEDEFFYAACDVPGACNIARVSITLIGTPPQAVTDHFALLSGQAFHVAAPGVLLNDTNDDGPLSAALDTQPQYGTVNLSPDGSFEYDAPEGFIGDVSFTYHAYDAFSVSAPVTVELEVTLGGGGSVPQSVDDAFVIPAGEVLQVAAPGVLWNDSDADQDALHALLVDTTAHGDLQLEDDGAFTYVPASNYFGVDTFRYQVTDGSLISAIATVRITVTAGAENQPPVGRDDTFDLISGQPFEAAPPGVLWNDADPEGNLILGTLVPMDGPDHGMLEFDADGSFVYVPDAGFVGTDQFAYFASDGQFFSQEVFVGLHVWPIGGGQTPVARDDSYTAHEGYDLMVPPRGVLMNDTDAENDHLVIETVGPPASGSVVLGDDGGFVYRANDGFFGTDMFTYRVTDGHSSSNVATVTIVVDNQSSPHAPTALGDTYSTNSGGALDVAAPGVLGNDIDPDGGALQALLIGNGPSHGHVDFDTSGAFRYTPDANFVGTDSFVYRATDGTWNSNAALVMLNVTGGSGGNQAPHIEPGQAFFVPEDVSVASILGQVVATDDGQPSALTYAIVGGNIIESFSIEASSGRISVAKPLDYELVDTFALEIAVSDGELASTEIVTVTVQDVEDGPGLENRAPIVVDDAIEVVPGGSAVVLVGGAPSVLSNDSDPDLDSLTARSVTEPENGSLTFNPDGTFRYDNTNTAANTDNFEYEACDTDGMCSTGIVNINITETSGNHLPVAIGDAIQVAPGSLATVLTTGAISVLANDTDLDHDPLHAIVIAQPVHGDLTMVADGTFVYSHHADDPFPLDAFTYEACDSHGGCSAALVAITIAPLLPVVNCVPRAYTYDVGDSVLLDFAGVFTAPQGQSLTYTAQNIPASLTVNGATGVLSGTLTAADTAGSPFVSNLRATTVPGGGVATAHVDITVLPAGERFFDNGFDGNLATPICH